MRNSEEKIVKYRFLKWLMRATLVFSLFAFSGHATQSQSYNSELTKTELKHASSAISKRIVSFNQVQRNSNLFLQPLNFNAFLLSYDREIEIKLKRNISSIRPKEKQFVQLVQYAAERAELSVSSIALG